MTPAALALALFVAAEPSLDGLAEEVARLRGEIETLDARLEEQRETRRSQLRALAAQKSTMELELQREELRKKQLADRLARSREKASTSKERQAHLKSAVLAAIDKLRATLRDDIPFQITERTTELDAIRRETESDALLPSLALGRVWEWVDAEIKRTRDNGLHQQVVQLEGEEVLADVARIGMVALYFRAPGEKYGMAVKKPEGWTWELSTRLEDQERIKLLFSALDQDNAKGLFVLPNALHLNSNAAEASR